MHLLVLNPGSSTLKYRLVEIDATRITPITSGNLEELSGERIAQAAGEALRRCQGHPIDAVGCRIVHGGEQFAEPVRLTPAILGAIRDLGRLAPLHNYFAAEVLGALTTHLPGVPAVVVFDTALHRPFRMWPRRTPCRRSSPSARATALRSLRHLHLAEDALSWSRCPG
ncbi:MAG: hypothetical protein U0840_28325 [Gemmataceae bacterium]